MNSTSLDINVSETLANKTLIVTTILVRYRRLLDHHADEVSLVVMLLCRPWHSSSRVAPSVFAHFPVTVAVIATDRVLRGICQFKQL